MTGRPASRGCTHPIYSEYRQQVGEDPARVLYHLNPHPRVRGLRSVETARAYLDVETDREDPRRKVVAHLNRRIDELQAGSQSTLASASSLVSDGGEQQCQ